MSTTTEQNTTANQNMEAIRLAVEVVCLMRRGGYLVKDEMVLEVIELCSKVASSEVQAVDRLITQRLLGSADPPSRIQRLFECLP